MTLINLADWSKIEANSYKYTPVDDLMRETQGREEVNGLVINGDIGYDLDSNNCSNYEKFLVMLSGMAASLPLLMVTGNHEYNSKDNWKLYASSFKLYGLDS